MTDKTMSDILGDFKPEPSNEEMLRDRRKPVTIWLSPEQKDRYDGLQKKSGRRFSKKVREAVLALIDYAEARAG